jgi:hypothetical protein
MLKSFRDFHLQKTIQHLISTEMPAFLIFTHIPLPYTLHWHHVHGYSSTSGFDSCQRAYLTASGLVYKGPVINNGWGEGGAVGEKRGAASTNFV